MPYTAPFWVGYSPQHMRETESAVGTITLRASTLNAVLYDILRSLIHHGWNKLILVNGHGSNTKVIDPLLRRIKYETGALVALYKPYAERYIGILEGPAGEPAGGDAGLARVRARDLAGAGAQRGAGPHGPRRRRPRAGAVAGCRSRS